MQPSPILAQSTGLLGRVNIIAITDSLEDKYPVTGHAADHIWACPAAALVPDPWEGRADISAGLLLLLLGLLQHKWKMRDAEVKGCPQGCALGFQSYYLGWGSVCLLSPPALSAHFVPQGAKFPGSPGQPLCCCCHSPSQQQLLTCPGAAQDQRAALGLPWAIRLEERCGFGVENDQFSVIFAKDNGCLG